MIRIFKTENGLIHQKDELSPGSWIALTKPDGNGDSGDCQTLTGSIPMI